MLDVELIRKDFPILNRLINNKPLIYLDNGASAQKPGVVIEAITNSYSQEYANVHRGLYHLSNLATEKYESVRGIVAKFLNAPNAKQIVLNSGTTEGINSIAYGWAMPRLEPGDEIILSIMEHHANIVPWHFLREKRGVILKWIDLEEDGSFDEQRLIDAISPKTKLIAITHLSNVLGTKVDVKRICQYARKKGVPVVVDGSQAAAHMPVDVQDIGCDFYAVTGHKLYGPTGSGALYISQDRMREMKPFMGGGDMIKEVHKDLITYNEPPMIMEAGTPGIVQTIGLGVALEYLLEVGMSNVASHETDLTKYANQELSKLNWLNIQGNSPDKAGIFSFTIEGAGHPHDISTVLDKKGVCVRAGHHCAQPLMEHLGVSATCRASVGLYNTKAEIDSLVDALKLCHELFA